MDEIIAKVKGPRSGAIVVFNGVVRADPGVEALDIEVYQEMSLKVLREIRVRALSEFDINEVAIVHRVGHLVIGDNIVIIAVAAPSRENAFKACRFIIDELKSRTPIWKKEGGS